MSLFGFAVGFFIGTILLDDVAIGIFLGLALGVVFDD